VFGDLCCQLIAESEVVLGVDLDKIDSIEQLLDQIPNLGFFEKLLGKEYSIYEKAVSICIHDESCTEFGKLKLLQAALRLPEDAIKNREEGVWRSYCEEEIKKGVPGESLIIHMRDLAERLHLESTEIKIDLARGWLSHCEEEIKKGIPGESLIIHMKDLAERLHLETADINKGLTYELYCSLLTQEYCDKSIVDDYKRLFDLTDDALPEDIVKIIKSKENIARLRNGRLESIQVPMNLIRNETFHLKLVDVVCEYPGPGDSYKTFNGNLYISNLRVVFDNMERVIPLRFSEILNFHVELYRHTFRTDGRQIILPIEDEMHSIGELVEKNKLLIAKKGLRKKIVLNAINIECAYELLSKLMPGVGKTEYFKAEEGFWSL